jgi:hypothetical protein
VRPRVRIKDRPRTAVHAEDLVRRRHDEVS